MTSEEAIRLLEAIYDDRKAELNLEDNFPGQQALKLGVEALKRVNDMREMGYIVAKELLPGETKEK